MAITDEVLRTLADWKELRIEALNAPASAGQPQVFQIRPLSLFLSPIGELVSTTASLAAAIPVEISVVWGLEKHDGVRLQQKEGVVYAPPLQQTLQAIVMASPDFVELKRNQELTTKTVHVTATVTLTAYEPADVDHTKPIRVELPILRHPLTVPSVPIPTVALFFHAANLGMDNNDHLASGHQFVLIGVPADSPIGGVTALRDACERLQRISKTARDLAQLAGFGADGLASLVGLGVGLEQLTKAIDAHVICSNVGVAFVSRDGVRNLNNIDMILQRWNDVEAEDEISSIVLLGPPDRRLAVFQKRDYSGRDIHLEVSEQCITIVRSLRDVPPVTDPPNKSIQSSDSPPLDNSISSFSFL